MIKKRILVLLLTDLKNRQLWEKYEKDFKKYFKLEIIKDDPSNISKYLDKPIDILFLDNPHKFKLQFYRVFKKNEQSFSYIALYDEMDPSRDSETYQIEIVDRIIYSNIDENLYKWSIISTLRRFWDSYSKPSTIIYKHIVADFIERRFWINKKRVELTPKESSILRILLMNKKEYVKKNFIFKEIWGFKEDNTRTVDQTLFKLKRKIGSSCFLITRNKGVMLR